MNLQNTRNLLALLAVRRRLDDCIVDLECSGCAEYANQLTDMTIAIDCKIKTLESVVLPAPIVS